MAKKRAEPTDETEDRRKSGEPVNSGIYVIQNVLDGKVYVGQAANLALRQSQHFRALYRGDHRNIHLQRAFNRDGAENFEFMVIEYAHTKLLAHKEQEWLDNTAPNKRYNICKSSTSSLGVKRRPETRQAQSERKKKCRPEWLFTKESREKAGKAISKNWHRHKKRHTLETNAKISRGLKARWAIVPKARMSDEARRKMSEAGKRRWVESPMPAEAIARATASRAARRMMANG